MSFQDSAVIFFIALLLFGPKKLPELARQIGKLMGEFRRASNDFRMQMEDELRISEQADRQKQIAAIEAAAPASAVDLPVDLPSAQIPHEELAPHPHAKLSAPAPLPFVDKVDAGAEPPLLAEVPEHTIAAPAAPDPPDRSRHAQEPSAPAAPLPIATSGDLAMMPPPSGLPVGRTSPDVIQAFDSIPQAPVAEAETNQGTGQHG